MTAVAVTSPDLDHLAIAAERSWPNLARYGGQLGGRFVGGGPTTGFHWCQVAFSNDMRLELLQPHDVDSFDFLRRFLDRNGPGPHHVTVKVPSLDEVVAGARAAGYQVVGENRTDPRWQEAFLHPTSSHGIVVQLAQPGDDDPDPVTTFGAGDGDPLADQLPPTPEVTPSLDHLVHIAADKDAAVRLLTGVLGGRVAHGGRSDLGSWTEVRWPGPGAIRVVGPDTPLARAWLGDRPGRLHHVTFSGVAVGIDGATRLADGTWELAPERNEGLRLRWT